ncbi:glycosyl transferase [Diaphorobacter sp. LR2014-1]|uniref:glycosyltransferase family 2 protein n=1 Tax=Diaphorobacter sp. LR2014-1 TaxID=1933219 RepID=UPI001FF07E6F|nr:glycosyl transferase [Diaphorobacter sp. LR2014-1]
MNEARASSSEPQTGLVVSIVSHGHGVLVQRLLGQLAEWSAGSVSRVVLTHNIPEPTPQAPITGWPFRMEIVFNAVPRGFGANHNRALQDATEAFVCVLNPDVELLPTQEPFTALMQAAATDGVGCAYPMQLDADGGEQDYERELPSPRALWRRRVLRQPQRKVDWVNAACIVLPKSAWQLMGGFDEAYFMYCEDVDLCLRLRLAGLRLQKTQACVLHVGHRASRKQWRHLVWHVRSLLRLWRSGVYRQTCGIADAARRK